MKKKKVVSKTDIIKQIKKVDALFAKLEKDKSLPTFIEHMMLCIVLGKAEKVNLKEMYPKVHDKIYRFVHMNSNA